MIQRMIAGLTASALLALAAACSSGGDVDTGGGTGAGRVPASGPEAQGKGMGTMEPMAEMTMGSTGPIRLTARQAALAGVSFAVAKEQPLTRTVRAVARVVPDERRQGIVNTRVSGWVERLLVEETGRRVAVGQPLFELYAPDLVTAQEELLLAKRLDALAGGDTLAAAARRRLSLWGIDDELVDEIERSGQVLGTLTIRSPFQGTVLAKHVIEGQHVRAGETLFEIGDLSTVWIEPAIFEQDIDLVTEGQRARVTFDALPGRVHEGRVSFVHPTLDPSTRTLKVRVEVPNPSGNIRPGMYGAVSLDTQGPASVTVPLTAVLPTGQRDLAFVLRGGGVVPTDVVVGERGDSTLTVVEGLAAGDTVVSSATFLFDSESSLGAAMAGIMLDMGMGLDMGGMDMGGMEMGGMDMRPTDMDGMDMGADSTTATGVGAPEPDTMRMDAPPDSGASTPRGDGSGRRP